MSIQLQLRINENPIEKKFLRENSYWYKYLNRSNLYYKAFLDDMKSKYKLTTQDKINSLINNINTIKSFLDVLQ